MSQFGRRSARCLWQRLAREPRPILRCAERELWRDLPSATVASPRGCAQLVLLMLARRLLYFKPTETGSVLVCARMERRGMEAMRRSPLCMPAAPVGATRAAAANSSAEEAAALDQMLAELGVMERRVACALEELEALRCHCMCAAARLGRKDLLGSSYAAPTT